MNSDLPIGNLPVTISVYASLQELEPAWKSLEQEQHHYAFQTFEWINTWQQHVGHELAVSPCPVLVTTSEEVALCLLPLGIQKRSGLNCLIWLGGQLADYHGALFSARSLIDLNTDQWAGIWNAIQKKLPPHDAVIFENQPQLINGLPNPFVLAGSFDHPCAAHATSIQGSLDEFLKSKRSSKWLSQQRRKARRLADAGEIEFVAAATNDDISRLLPVMLKQKRSSYQEMGVPDLFNLSSNINFVTEMTKGNLDGHFVVLFALTVDSRIAATVWGLTYQGRLYHLLPTYANDELTRWSPGNLLLHKVFEWCLENGINKYDFTAGDEDYKMLWCDEHLQLFDYLEGITLKGKIYATLQKCARQLKTRIKQSPLLFSLAKKARSITGG